MPITRRKAKANARVPPGRARALGRCARSLSTTAPSAGGGAGQASAGLRLDQLCAVCPRESVFAETHRHARGCELAAFNCLDPGAAGLGNREQEQWDRQLHEDGIPQSPMRAEVNRAIRRSAQSTVQAMTPLPG